MEIPGTPGTTYRGPGQQRRKGGAPSPFTAGRQLPLTRRLRRSWNRFARRFRLPRGEICVYILVVFLLGWICTVGYMMFSSGMFDGVMEERRLPAFLERVVARSLDNRRLEIYAGDDNRFLPANMEIPPILGPAVMPSSSEMLRFVDSMGNYTNSSVKHMHGDLGKQADGAPHDWESSLDQPLDRNFPDYREAGCKSAVYFDPQIHINLPAASVVIIFCNEPWETLMRSVHSVLNRTPPHLLKEVVLVDDGSDHADLREDGNGRLDGYVKMLPKVKLVRTGMRAGIPRARLAGVNAASADVFVILDSHIECQDGWLEPLVYRIQQQPNTFVMPQIDNIKKDKNWTPNRGGVGCTLGIIWKVMEHAFHPDPTLSPPDRLNTKAWDFVSSPTMAGGLFAGNRNFFLSIGAYDLSMKGWGAENVEFSFRLWQCGGRLECTECSRVSHAFGRGQFYKVVDGSVEVNRMRTIATWMDEFAVVPWRVMRQPDWKIMGDITDRLRMRKTLQCKPYKWFLENVWPESDVRKLPEDLPYVGMIKHQKSGQCFAHPMRGRPAAPGNDCRTMYWSRVQRITSEWDDETCLFARGGHSLDWNWCQPHDQHQRFVIDIVERGTTEDVGMLRSIPQRRCLSVDGSALQMVSCDPENAATWWQLEKFDVSGFVPFVDRLEASNGGR